VRKILIASGVIGLMLCGCGGFFGYRGITMAERIARANVSQQQFSTLRVGQSEDSARKSLPTPLDADVVKGGDSADGIPPGAKCIYYRADGGGQTSGTALFRFCFKDGKLTDKRTVEVD
jgi:hypothetical protein